MSTEIRNNAIPLERDAAAINESLILALVRQHELTEQAELLNTQLQEEIVARKKAEDALVNVEKLASVGRMAAVLAHEINNPLAAVMNALYLTQTMKDLPEAAHEYLETADAELKRIAHVTRQALGFYQEISAPKSFHVAALLDSVLDLLRAKIVTKKATVQKQCSQELQMNGMEGELRQVFSNMLMNALDAVAEGGRVTLRAHQTQGFEATNRRISFTLSDNGCGISPSALDEIFKPFFTTKGSVGNGLGLWVCKQIIEKHAGSIHVRSCMTGPYRGTTVLVVLPGAGI